MGTNQLLLPYGRPRRRYYLRAYWTEAARQEGCATPNEALRRVYRRTRSLRRTARRLGFSKTQVRARLLDLGEPLRRPGGCNNPWGRAGKPD